MPKKVLIYSRKSAYTGKGDSIENQIDICKEYALRQFGTDCAFFVYEDEGFSGKNTVRPEFQRMMRDVHNEQYDILICYRLDRISRSVSDFSAVLDDLTLHHVDFASVREHFDTSTPIGRAMIYIASVFAELERETIAERIRDNKYKLYRTGHWQGGFAPVGLKTCKVQGLDETGRTRSHYELDVDEANAAHVKMLFEKFSELGSVTKLETYLLRNNINTVAGKEYSAAVLRQILTNPVYTANTSEVYDYLSTAGCDLANDPAEYDGQHSLVAYGKTKTTNAKISKRARADRSGWVIAISPHRGIVSGSEWVSVQERITTNGQKRPRAGTSNVALFSGLIRCGQCGSPMLVCGNTVRKNGTAVFYYKCDRKSRSSGGLCGVQNINGVKFDKIVVDLLKDFFSGGGVVSESLKKQFKSIQLEQENCQKEIQKIRGKIAENKERMTNLAFKLGDHKDSDLDAPILDAIRKAKLETETLQRRLEDLSQSEGAQLAQQFSLDAVRTEMRDFCKSFDTKSLEEKRVTLQTIVRRITWYGNEFEIELFGEKLRGKASSRGGGGSASRDGADAQGSSGSENPYSFTSNTGIRYSVGQFSQRVSCTRRHHHNIHQLFWSDRLHFFQGVPNRSSADFFHFLQPIGGLSKSAVGCIACWGKNREYVPFFRQSLHRGDCLCPGTK